MAVKYHIGRDKMPHPCKASIRECEFAENGHGDLEMMAKISEIHLENEFKENMKSLQKVKKRGGLTEEKPTENNVETYIHPQGKVITVNPDGSLTVTKDGKPATSSATLAKLRAGHGAWKRDDGTQIEVKPQATRSKVRKEPTSFSQVRVGDEVEVTYVRPPRLTGYDYTDYQTEKVKIKSVEKGRIEFEDGARIYLNGKQWAYGSGANRIKFEKTSKMRNEDDYPKIQPNRKPRISKVDKKVSDIVQNFPDEKITKNNFDSEKFGGNSYEDIIFDKKDVFNKLRNAHPNFSDEQIISHVIGKKKEWEVRARTELPKNGDEDVPTRLLPVGTETTLMKVNGYSRVTIASPVNNGPTYNFKTSKVEGPDDIVGSYHDGIQRQYVDPNTTWDVFSIPPNKKTEDGQLKIPAMWRSANEKAEELQKIRKAVEEHNAKY